MQNRRAFLSATLTTIAAIALFSRRALAVALPDPHPTPRPGITGAKVATAERLADKPQLVELFDAVRQNPQIIDGIRCNCGCSHNEGFYSLLTCYEGEKPMARECAICQGQGRLATRLHKVGKTLDEIRAAIDAKYAG